MYRTILRLLTAAALASAATVPPTAAPAVDAPEGAAGMTTLTLLVHACDGCSITPVQAGDGSAPALWQGRTKKVRHGAVRWKVATRHTLGMSFNIVDFDGVALDSMTNIVVAYRGLKVGARVPNGVAATRSAPTAVGQVPKRRPSRCVSASNSSPGRPTRHQPSRATGSGPTSPGRPHTCLSTRAGLTAPPSTAPSETRTPTSADPQADSGGGGGGGGSDSGAL